MRSYPATVVFIQGLLVGVIFGGIQRTIYGNGSMQSLCCFFVAHLAIAGGPEAEEAPNSFFEAGRYDITNTTMFEAEDVPDSTSVDVDSTRRSLPEAEEATSLYSVAGLCVDSAAEAFAEVEEAPNSFFEAGRYDITNTTMFEAEDVPDSTSVDVDSTRRSLPEAEEATSLYSVAGLCVNSAAEAFAEVDQILNYAIFKTLGTSKHSWAVALAVRHFGDLLAGSRWLNISVSTCIIVPIILLVYKRCVPIY